MVLVRNFGEPVDLHIPAVLPGGVEIRGIGSNIFVSIDTWKRVSFDENIEVSLCSFRNITADTLVWPKGQKEIPDLCFSNASIGTILGMEDVTFVGYEAFEHSRMQTLTWPSATPTVPKFCFQYASIENIKGLENVVSVEEGAFSQAKIGNMAWPQKASKIPFRCFSRSEIRNLTGPENIDVIGSYAFENAKFESLDLSSAIVLEIGKGAFFFTDINCVIKPYYMSEEQFKSYFLWKIEIVNQKGG